MIVGECNLWFGVEGVGLSAEELSSSEKIKLATIAVHWKSSSSSLSGVVGTGIVVGVLLGVRFDSCGCGCRWSGGWLSYELFVV